jgi:hypothetical protein
MWWYLVAILAFLLVLAIALIADLRKSPEEEAKRIKRQDELAATKMGDFLTKAKDDPNEPARWVP